MGSKDKPGNFDCYANAENDEPMFVLLARDGHAPHLVETWAELREEDGEDPAKVEEARKCARDMRRWRLLNRPDPNFDRAVRVALVLAAWVRCDEGGEERWRRPNSTFAYGFAELKRAAIHSREPLASMHVFFEKYGISGG